MTGPDAGELEVERSGGFGGLTLRARARLADLGPGERAALEECFRQPATGPPRGADRFVYRLRAGGREALVPEDRVPAGLRPLLDRLSSSWARGV